ncbi:MAG: UDP-N-acetylmuramate--L-alanine ligase [Patescibacteria group bacterium]
MDLKQFKHAHLVGIGGISISAIAKLFLKGRVRVSGFDAAQSEITDELERMGVRVVIGDAAAQLPDDVDVLIYSEAVPEHDALRTQARKRGIAEMAGAEFWGQYSRGKKVIAISGTNGKSTTTAMVGLMLCEAGFDPTVVVGTRVLAWDSNIRIGKSDWLVIEADEYAAKMLHYKPQIAVITNIAPDHLDFYKDAADIIARFQKWIDAMPANGVVVVNRDDEASRALKIKKKMLRAFGVKGSSGVRAAGISQASGASAWLGFLTFNIVDDRDDWGYINMRVPGEHTIANAVAAACAADSAGVPRKKICKALTEFTGTWRRFEMVGEFRKALVISDYAHHPDGIRATLKAARDWYPFHRMLVLFQPHHHNRTKKLFRDFAASFGRADEVIISEIYDVSGREDKGDQDVSSKDLVDAVKNSPSFSRRGRGGGHVSYAKDLREAEAMLKAKIKPEDVVIVMGAGDVDAVARRLVISSPPFTKGGARGG